MQVKKWICLFMALLLLPALVLAEEMTSVAPIAVNNEKNGVCTLKHEDGRYVLSGTAQAGAEIVLRVTNIDPSEGIKSNGIQLTKEEFVPVSAEGVWETEVSEENATIKDGLENGKPVYLLGRYEKQEDIRFLCELRFDAPAPSSPTATVEVTVEKKESVNAENEGSLKVENVYYLRGQTEYKNAKFRLEILGGSDHYAEPMSDADGYIDWPIEDPALCAPGTELTLEVYLANGTYDHVQRVTVPGQTLQQGGQQTGQVVQTVIQVEKKYAFVWLKDVHPIVLALLLVAFAGATAGLTVVKNIHKRGAKPARIKEVA